MDPRHIKLFPNGHYSSTTNHNNNVNKPRYRVLVRKMNPNQMMRAPKQESSSRRYVQQTPPNRPTQQRNAKKERGGGGVTIEEVPNNAYLEQLNNSSSNGQSKVDEDKLPVFLIKLWNIVEDAQLQSIVHWDESGASFHIADPYSFCRNVLPHFFKHNNLNSLIRQLNMYGFRKMTPLSQGGLTRTESDQDHLEFSHPCFVQGRPELLTQIKRKQSAKTVEDKQVNEQTQQSLDIVMAEMRSMRDKAKNMEDKMNKLTKENRDMWNQMGAMRQTHARQQQYFKKLLHFLVSVMQPGLSKRVAKSDYSRGVLEIDFGANGGTPNKRARMNSDEGPYKDVCELLESLQRESQEPFNRRGGGFNDHGGPLISEVTDEFGNSPGGGRTNQDLFSDGGFDGRFSDSGSREPSPHPIVSTPVVATQKPKDMYLGSGALTHENVHRPPVGGGAGGGKRDFQGQQMTTTMTSGGAGYGGQQNGAAVPGGRSAAAAQKRAPYKQATRNLNQTMNPQEFQGSSNNYNFNPIAPQLTYSQMPTQQQLPPQKSLMAIEDHQSSSSNMDPHQNMYSPTLGLSPSFDRQFSQELQEYFSGMDNSMDSLRDMVTKHNWDSFGDDLPEDDEEQDHHFTMNPQNGGGIINGGGGSMNGSAGQGTSGGGHQGYPLALKNSPENQFYDDSADLLDPLLGGDNEFADDEFQVPTFQDPNYMPLGDSEIFPRSPVLRTPSPSDPNPNLV